MLVLRRMGRVKWTDKIKNGVMLERVGEGRIMLLLTKRRNNAGTDEEEEKKLAGPLAKKKLPTEGYSRRNSKREESLQQKKI